MALALRIEGFDRLDAVGVTLEASDPETLANFCAAMTRISEEEFIELRTTDLVGMGEILSGRLAE